MDTAKSPAVFRMAIKPRGPDHGSPLRQPAPSGPDRPRNREQGSKSPGGHGLATFSWVGALGATAAGFGRQFACESQVEFEELREVPLERCDPIRQVEQLQ
jgi:hypothetical protein